MDFLPGNINDYVDSHSGIEDSLLEELRRETHQKVLNPRMLSGSYQGRFLSMISKLVQPELILEIGTYTGYSALCMAEGMKESGILHTIDINEELNWIRQKYIDKSAFKGHIFCHDGDAIEIIPKLGIKEIDLLFIDADKSNYINYYNLCLPLMKAGGLILVDNVLWSGKVLEEVAPSDIDTKVLKELNDIIQDDPRVDKLMLPIRDGLFLIRKK